MERVSLEITKREIGKSVSRGLRRQATVPGVLYGSGRQPMTVVVNEKALEKASSTHAGLNVLIDLNLEGGEKVLARICDYQADPIKRNFTHVDFQALDLNKKISADVPIHFEGKAIGVKEGGVLLMDRRNLQIKCLPLAIPENILIDISELKIGDSIHIDDVKLPSGVECPHETNFGVVSVVAPMKEEVAAPAAAVEGAPVEGAAAPGAAPAAPGAVPAAGAKPAPGAAPAAGAKPAPGAAPVKEKK